MGDAFGVDFVLAHILFMFEDQGLWPPFGSPAVPGRQPHSVSSAGLPASQTPPNPCGFRAIARV